MIGTSFFGITKSIFDQEYATEMYGEECKREGAIEATVKMCKRFGTTVDEAVNMLAEDFGLSAEDAAQYVNELWKN